MHAIRKQAIQRPCPTRANHPALLRHSLQSQHDAFPAALAIELNGDIHKSDQEYDQERTELLRDHSIELICPGNEDAIKRLSEVLQEIEHTCSLRMAQIHP